jgi:thiol:disulfide interchange protein DsbD
MQNSPIAGYIFSLITFFVLLINIPEGFAQLDDPVTWKVEYSIDGDELTLTATATIDPEWYLYGSDIDPDLGPMPTAIEWDNQNGLEPLTDLIGIDPKTKYDEIWEGDITYFVKKAVFTQVFEINNSDFSARGYLVYQTCTLEDGKCIPGQHEFTLANDSNNSASAIESKPDSEITALLEEEEGLGGFLIVAFLFGLGAVFTPCVFPIIPLTVSFFGKTGEGNSRSKAIKTGLLFMLSTILIYASIGLILTIALGADAANLLSTHWLPNLIFFFIFLIFALSFFGLFELTLPSALATKLDKKAESGNWIAPLFMALTLVVVSFSCTGPLAGTLLVQAASGSILRPTLGMMAFALALSLPFTLLAIFPVLMNRMPRSGQWMNVIKVSFGFLELALAFKFLSIADTVYRWGILDRDINIAIWMAIFSFMALYYLGKITFNHEAVIEKIHPVRMLLALVSFTFVIYLTPGLFGAPLPMLSGVLPPLTTQDYTIEKAVEKQLIDLKGTQALNIKNDNKLINRYDNYFESPHGLKAYYDLDDAKKAARELNKPILLDFTGHGCANCRKVEDVVWSDLKILAKLKEDFVIASLYVDDRLPLPSEEKKFSKALNQNIKTLGQKNMAIQIELFNKNAQPLYAIIAPDGSLRAGPIGFTTNKEEYLTFLEKGSLYLELFE